MPAMSNDTALFKPTYPGQPVTILMLVENSKTMLSYWPDLRDSYLPNVLGSIWAVNPDVPIQFLLIPTSPVPEVAILGPLSSPRGGSSLHELQFDHKEENKISARHILHAVHSLASLALGKSASLHLFIVAASGESAAPDGTESLGAIDMGISYWQLLGHKMAQHNIHCHMVLNTVFSVQGFHDMFYEHMRLQDFDEVGPWFQPNIDGFKSYFSTRRISEVPAKNSSPTFHPILPRSFSYPSDLSSLSGSRHLWSATSETPGNFARPTLVNTIQQTWGLTKKKIYTAQPVREPFIRDERVREMPNQVPPPPPPLPLSGNSNPIHAPTKDPRVAKSKSGRRGEKTSPHELTSRRPVPYPRRSSLISPVSSPIEIPENHLLNVSNIGTAPLVNPHDCTPVSPFVSSPMATSPSADTFYNAHPSSGFPNPPAPVDYFSTVHGLREPPLQNTVYNTKAPLYNTASRSQSVSEVTPSSPGQPNAYYSDVNYMYSPVSQVSCAESATAPQKYNFPPVPPLSPRLLAAASMDGNVPFVFSEEKELETKAMLKAAGLQEVPLPQIVEAMSTRAGHPLPPNSPYTSPKLPLSNHAPWLSSMPSSSVPPTVPSIQGRPHHSSFSAPQTHLPIQDATICSFERDQVQNTVPGTSSLTRWNG